LKTFVWYEIDSSIDLEKLDMNICLFINELTSYGFFSSKDAKEQKLKLRKKMINSCLEHILSF
jgi:hypothetical protein